MAKRKEKRAKNYLTKSLLLRRSRKAIQTASEDALEIAGYVVVVEKNQVVRRFKDGRVEVIVELEKNDQQLNFD